MAKGKTYTQKKDVRVDFTPMVDMNMLLITFFMLCTTMIKSQTLQISLPSNEKVEQKDQNKVKQSEAITIILDSELNKDGVPVKDFIYYYEGMPEVATGANGSIESNMKESEFKGTENGKAQGIRAILQERNKAVLEKVNVLKEKWKANQISDSIYQAEAKKVRNDSTLSRPVIIIKATPNASYKSVVTALDEMQINNISRYQIDRINTTDSAMMTPYLLERLKNK